VAGGMGRVIVVGTEIVQRHGKLLECFVIH
jgi:hypothetical protein